MYLLSQVAGVRTAILHRLFYLCILHIKNILFNGKNKLILLIKSISFEKLILVFIFYHLIKRIPRGSASG